MIARQLAQSAWRIAFASSTALSCPLPPFGRELVLQHLLLPFGTACHEHDFAALAWHKFFYNQGVIGFVIE